MIRPRLTSHQRDVLRELTYRSRLDRRWIDARDIGSRVALDHLVRKGYAERRMTYGPRGGEHPEYRPA